jgi:CDP-glycerol glycerophosphotransferase (TagB/SpsB family)
MEECLLKKMIQLGEKCIVRTHPYQSKKFNSLLNEFIVKNPKITWSNSRLENLETYFSQIDALIAGTSSIHLEAAIAGLPTFHHEMASNVLYPDYYGYVKNGVSIMLEKDFDLQLFKDSIKLSSDPAREAAIRLYSSTFHTKWQGREGDLVASIIREIVNKESNIVKMSIGI